MKTLAVTGSSGSGKTTIAELFLKLDGTILINTDELAREMAENDKKYLNDIILAFGAKILNSSSGLDRKKLSKIIAEDNDSRIELNRITKKNLMPKIDKIIEENKDKKLIVVDVPILYENQLENYFDKVLAIVSDKDEQIKRIMKRDRLNREEAEARLNMQLDNDFFSENADFVIVNFEKSTSELYKEVSKVYLEIMSEDILKKK